ncbi:hypothetical protein ABW19_dt0201833 [Dactylella cylindrospora]|nr:hypothetical protein ABW19_dt0201833 [Dactylella cylindrospora]
MSLSPSDTKQLFSALQSHDFDGFWEVKEKLLNHPGTSVRNIPIRVYNPETGQVIQGSVPVKQAGTIRGDPHSLGTALNMLVPILFPSKRSVILARPVMHGVVLPMNNIVAETACDGHAGVKASESKDKGCTRDGTNERIVQTPIEKMGSKGKDPDDSKDTTLKTSPEESETEWTVL